MGVVKWINHNNKKVLLLDFCGVVVEYKMLQLLKTVHSFLPKSTDEQILVLNDITGCFLTPGFIEEAKRLDKEVFNKYNRKEAIVGIRGPKVILLKAYNLVSKYKLVPFENRDKALEYLTQD